MKSLILAGFSLFYCTIAMAKIIAEDYSSWPKVMEVKGYEVTIYQPQTESYQGDFMQARSAFSVKLKNKPVFGAMWFSCYVTTDKEERLVLFDQFSVEEVSFPEDDKDKIEDFKEDFNQQVYDVQMVMNLDEFLTDLEELEERRQLDLEFNNAAPKIYYETQPSVLVMIDGDPILKDLENSPYKYVVNTPYFILSDTRSGTSYLKGGDWWYTSKSLTRGWQSASSVPSEVEKIAEQAFTSVESQADSAVMNLDAPPKVIISTEPAELIQSDGEAEFSPISGTNLLFIENSESAVIMDIDSQEYYVVISGRWYRSKSMENGTWAFVRPDELPAGFKDIPQSSEVADVRTSVAGTQEAREAVLEHSIPQTAEVDRKTATVEVSYDGNPKFEKISGTELLFAENADKTVLKSGDKYYCADQGIWFESDNATGPWTVSVVVPEGVEDIPPSSAAYNLKHLEIYESTPDVVYVGYTPGYYWSFPYYGSIVYGTGYRYVPWYYRYYYPRPVTYGFGVHYNPWTGWGFNFGISYGWLSFSFHSGGYYGWWGPGGYRYGYRHGYGRGYRHGYWSGYNRGYAQGYRRGMMDSRRPGWSASNNRQRPQPLAKNIYSNRPQGIKNTGVRPNTRPTTRPSTRPGNARPATGTPVQRPTTQPGQRPTQRPSQPTARPGQQPAQPATRPATRPTTQPGQQPAQPTTRPVNRPAKSTQPNNVYTDRSGNIYRQKNSGTWQQRQNNSWKRTTPPNNVNRSYQNRSRGQQRTRAYQRSPVGAGGGARMRR
jgi:hypothetical protein